MGLFKVDPAKRAERRRRRAERKRARAAAAEAKAKSFEAAGDEENATLIATNKDGRPVQQQVKLNKRGSRARNQRIATLEKELAEAKAEVESQDEEIDALTERIEKLEKHLDKRGSQGRVLSSGALRAAQGLVRILNVSDKVQYPGALVLAEGFKLSDIVRGEDDMDPDMARWMEVGATLLTAWAYYDRDVGLQSILQPDETESGNL